MACKSCGSNSDGISEVALPLTNPPSTCSSCSKPSASCGCEAFCEEDHISTTIYKRYGFTLRTVSSFVWPAPEETVTLQVSDVERLSPGSLLWNPTAGYLHVVSFDYTKQQIIAKNEGESCNTYVGGETLPECTDFVVGPPECNTGGTPLENIPYLAADFISPVAGECALASVTSIAGLTIGDTVSVNGYEYRIGDIIDNETIQLCNDGAGAPEGTVIEWDDDGDNIPNIPILVTASENPCTRDPVVAGVILVCDGTDVIHPLVGSVGGQIPVWNAITERFELKSLDIDLTICVSLTADLTTDSTHVGSYAVSVTDTSDFAVNDLVVISGFQYVINVIDSGVVMHITPLITPVGIIVYPSGTPVCLTVNTGCTDVGIVAPAGTNQATATELINTVNFVTVGTIHQGVRLPTPCVGREITVNYSSAIPILVYPNVGGAINGALAGLPITLLQYNTVKFVAISPTAWVYMGDAGKGVVQGASAVGTTQGNGYQIGTAVISFSTVAAGANACVLPHPHLGLAMHVSNADPADNLQVFPAVGDNINGFAANAVYALINNSGLDLVGMNNLTWIRRILPTIPYL